jgi:glycine cleavage system H protein
VAPEGIAGNCPIPDDRLYDVENDVWLKLSDDGPLAVLGLTAPIVSFAGRFQRVEYRPVTELGEPGRSVATVESVRYTGPVRLPARGRILRRNDLLHDRPKLLNDSPYEAGWLVEVELSDTGELERRLLRAPDARPAYAQKIAELRIHCLPAAPDAEMYEIGSECSAILAKLDEELARHPPNDVVLLVTDDPTSPIEMVRWTDRTGHTVLHHDREGTLHRFLIRREAEPHPRQRH